MNKPTWQVVYNEAKQAGIVAGNASVPVPMVVREHVNPLDDNSPIKRVYEPVMDGVCGFASVVVSDGRSSFANWARKNKIGYKDYYGGWNLPVHEHNQSLTRKEEHARAMCKVFSKYGIDCRMSSRMD